MTRQHVFATATALLASLALTALAPGVSHVAAAGVAHAQAVPRAATPSAPPSHSLKVVLLGTGGGPPVNLQQHGASILVEAAGQRFLFDCGRGAPCGSRRPASRLARSPGCS